MKRLPGKRKREELAGRVRRLQKEVVENRHSLHELDVYREEVHVQNEQLIETQHLLERSRDRYLDLFDLAPIGYVILDESGIVLDINLPGAESLGKERSKLIGSPLLAHVTPTRRREFLDHLRRVRKTEETLALDLEIQATGGRARNLEIRSRRTPLGDQHQILTAILDVTEKLKAAEDLGASEARMRIAVAAAGAGTWEWNPSAKRLSWSKDHFALLGLPETSRPTFEDWVQCVEDADRARLEKAGLGPSISKGDGIDVEYQVGQLDGSVRWLRTMGSTIPSMSGKRRSIGITIDITSLKLIEARLMRLNAALEERTAEAELSATQLRAAMAQITRTETEEQARLAEILHDHVQQVLVAADMKLAQLIRRSTTEKENEALAQVSGFVREALQKTSRLSKDYNPRILEEGGLLPALIWQASAMREEYGLIVRVERTTDIEPAGHDIRVVVFRAVKELLFNVVKHARTTRARVHVAANDGAMLEIEVSDSGAGFDAQKASGDENARGGQGIPRIRDRVLALGGQFELRSSDGKGTRAVIRVPIRSSVPERDSKALPLDPARSASSSSATAHPATKEMSSKRTRSVRERKR